MASKLTTTQINKLVNDAYAQMTGQKAVDTPLDLKEFCDGGSKEIGDLRDKLTGALAAAIAKNWYTDSSYRSEYKDDFFVDEQAFGAITQMISVTVPEVKENPAWNSFTSGVSTVGTYTVYLPAVETRYYTKQTAWSLPITIKGDQMAQAFRSVGDLASFVNYVWVMVDNAMVQHMKDMDNLNRANFIAEKINANATGVKGIHVFDPVKEYAIQKGLSSMTVNEFMNNKEAMIFGSEQFKNLIDYMREQTALFNTAGKVRFTPEDRLVVQILGQFENRMSAVAESSTFHKELISLPKHSTVAAWQSMEDLSFNGVSSINVTISDGAGVEKTIRQGGIVGLIADSWAIMHTIVTKRVGSQHFDIENLDIFSMQQVDKYMNNLDMNAIVIVLNDYTKG